MNFAAATLKKRPKTDALWVPFWQGAKKALPAAELGDLASLCQAPILAGDFTGKMGQTLTLYTGGKKEPRIILVGLGEKKDVTAEILRRAYSNATTASLSNNLSSASLLVPDALKPAECAAAVADGVVLSNYQFVQLKGEKPDRGLVKKIILIGAAPSQLKAAKEQLNISEGVMLARDLINGNADTVNPAYLVRTARSIAKQFPKVKATVFNKARIQKEKMGLLMAVGQGSKYDPAFIILQYRGNPKSKDHTVLVGKGITFDTGGLDIKPAAGMLTMKCDMGGAAVVLGALHAAAKTQLPINVTAVVPTAENAVDQQSYKPGDVHTSYAGITVEIGNTDAEGRLILADALAYTCKKLKPTRIIDAATLTGAMVIALGEECCGLMSNNDALAEAISRAGDETYERAWRMPLFEEYADQLKSDFADINNTGGRAAGSITAALFLQKFVGDTPWAHLDIAGPTFLSKARRYHPKNGSGFGVRLIHQFLKNHKAKN